VSQSPRGATGAIFLNSAHTPIVFISDALVSRVLSTALAQVAASAMATLV
tara:strand:+ start:445 stop:594 length:150 start_codon:yes stop_codon:yes gene_type:complete